MSLYNWRRRKLEERRIEKFYYLAHIENLASILAKGILPKNKVKQEKLSHYSFAEKGVQERRHAKDIILSDKSYANIHDLVPLYLIPKTPTLFVRREIQNLLLFFDISLDAVCDENHAIAFSDGNAGSIFTSFYKNLNKLDNIPWEVIETDYWNDHEDGKRKRCSEFLIHPKIEISHIERIVVSNLILKNLSEQVISEMNIKLPVEIDMSYFF